MLNYWKIFTTIFENMVSSSNHCFLSFGITGLILNKRMTFISSGFSFFRIKITFLTFLSFFLSVFHIVEYNPPHINEQFRNPNRYIIPLILLPQLIFLISYAVLHASLYYP